MVGRLVYNLDDQDSRCNCPSTWHNSTNHRYIALIVFIGIFLIILGVIDILIHTKCNEIVRLVESGDHRRAKERTLVWMILGFIFSWIIVGILLLVAYLKYDDLMKRYKAQPTPSPQMPPVQPF